MSNDNIETVKRLFRAVEQRDIEPMWEIYDPAVEINEAPSLPYGGHFHGFEGVMEHGLGYLAAWEDLQTDEDRDLEAEFIGAGDRVLVRWRQKAHTTEGQALSVPVVSDYLLRGGKVIESRMHPFDSQALAGFLAWAARRRRSRAEQVGTRALASGIARLNPFEPCGGDSP